MGGINKRGLRLQGRSKVKIPLSAWMSLCLVEGGKKRQGERGGEGFGGSGLKYLSWQRLDNSFFNLFTAH